MNSSLNPAKVFSEKWDVYTKLVQGNYLHHADFSEKTKEIFSRVQYHSIRILDLGCGDGLPVLPHLQKFEQADYTGYDLSAPALYAAAINLSKIPGTITLKEGDMLSLLQQETRLFDCIISSFSIHHLQDEKKLKLLEHCYHHLKPGGFMIYTDVFLIAQPGRNEYLEEYLTNIRKNWILLSDDEKQPIIDHISQYDFPAPLHTISSFCRSLGFVVTQKLQPDPWLAMLLLEKRGAQTET